MATEANSLPTRACSDTLRAVRGVFLVLGAVLTAIGVGISIVDFVSVHVKVPAPVAAANAWFSAINDKDLERASDDFLPADRFQTDWGHGDTSQWPTFADIHCRLSSSSRGEANVTCTFHESHSMLAGTPDTFWNIALVRSPGGWLIKAYGHG